MKKGEKIAGFHKAFGDSVRQTGASAENKALQTSLSHMYQFVWIKSVRLSNKPEDSRGIDLVFKTKDVGDLFIQIKSSRRAARRFSDIKRSTLIGVVIVGSFDDKEMIWNKIKDALLSLRQQILAKRFQVE
jgi:hypothetical protein